MYYRIPIDDKRPKAHVTQCGICGWQYSGIVGRSSFPRRFLPRLYVIQGLRIRPQYCHRFVQTLDLSARSFLRETTVPLFFERLQLSLTFGRLLSQPSNFSWLVYFCYVPTVFYRYNLLWERIVFCFRVVSVIMWYLLLHVFIL